MVSPNAHADPGKEVVALGEIYFAVQTHIREIQQIKAYNSTEPAANLFRATQTEEKWRGKISNGRRQPTGQESMPLPGRSKSHSVIS